MSLCEPARSDLEPFLVASDENDSRCARRELASDREPNS
jgi:hypothetical protein